MSGNLPVLKFGPLSFQASGLVLGGQLVVPTGVTNAAPFPAAPTAQTVMACTAANVTGLAAGFPNVLGIAGNDANVLTMPGLPSVNTYQQQQLDIAQEPDYVSVYVMGEFNVLFETVCPFGGPLQAGTAGGVQFLAGAATNAIIGRCMQPGGVSVASTTALAWIQII